LPNKNLKSPFSIKEKLNKEMPLVNSFSFLKILSKLIKRELNLMADKELIQG
jgi:hypothetical protein